MSLVAELTSRAETEKNDALRRAESLEKQLETLKKESQYTLDKVKADAQKREEDLRAQAAEREDPLVDRLRALANALSGEFTHHKLIVLFVFSLSHCK